MECQIDFARMGLVYDLVQQWLSGQSLTLDGLTCNSTSLAVSASGDHPPRNVDQLGTLIKKTYPTAPPISLAWTHSTPKTTTTTTADASAAIARTTTDTWTTAHPGTTVLTVDQTDTTATVTLTGPTKPTTEDLQTQLRAALPQMTITIQWIPSSTLSQSTPPPPR